MLRNTKKKLWLIISSCLAIAGVFGVMLLYNQLFRVSELDVIQSLQQAVMQTTMNINDRMAYAEDTLRRIVYDKRVSESLSRKPEEETLENQLREVKDLRELIYSVEENPDISRVRLYMSDIKMITREGINFFNQREAEDLEEYEPLLQSNGKFAWIGQHEIKTTYFQESSITLGCLYRTYFSPERHDWSLILIDLVPESFESILRNLDLPDGEARIAVTDAKGNIMFGDGNIELLAQILGVGEQYGFLSPQEHDEMAYITQSLDYGGWFLTAYMPRASLLNSRQTIRMTLTALIFGLTFLLLTLTGFTVYVLYTRSARDYIRAINRSLKTSNGQEPAHPPTHRALQNLAQNITELLETNKRLTSEKYRAELREREVTLQALQAQINPHFLYNTLDAINWMAMREGANDVSEVIATLAEYFRLSLSRGKSVVSLREDIEIAKKYLLLYRNRLDYEYDVFWSVDDDVMDCALPKLTLQPLIENALQHGIFKRSEKLGGIIRVNAEVYEDVLSLEVWDNGPGIKQQQNESGYGLMNVRERLDLYCAGKYSLCIENAPDGGAKVSVRVLRER